jgi:hypothetical protein
MAVELSKSPPIKVALIDDGVELHDEIFSNIEDGTSYAQPISPTNGPDEFFHSTRGHGTIMARIICKACPSVKLYVAKLNDTGGQGRFTMKYAAKVSKIPHLLNPSCINVDCFRQLNGPFPTR